MTSAGFDGREYYVNMASYHHAVDEIRDAHAKHLQFYGATAADCWIASIGPAPDYPRRGPKTHYQLRFVTYLGWKVYQRHTGALATIPAEEAKLEAARAKQAQWEAEEVARERSIRDANIEYHNW